MSDGTPAPGSPRAIEEGCTCDPEVNRLGEGASELLGFDLFVAGEECPLHPLPDDGGWQVGQWGWGG